MTVENQNTSPVEGEFRKGLVIQPVSGPTPETILGEMGVILPEPPPPTSAPQTPTAGTEASNH